MNLVAIVIAGLTGTFLSTLRSYLVKHMDATPYQFQTGKAPRDVYDFIVVGSGCGGSPVAARLSETGASVLLLETGGPAPPESAVPGLGVAMSLREDDDFIYNFVPQKHGMFGFQNNAMKVNYPKMMGGISSRDGMVFSRGNRRDFDNWARLGNTGWDFNSVLPYFKKLENFTEVNLPVDTAFHGFNGPIGISRKPIGPALNAFMKACRELGYNAVDANGREQIGFAPSYLIINNGVRSSASEGYVTPVKYRPNLDVRTRTTVQKVLFNSKRRAIGVQYFADGKIHTVGTKKEVILSAGAMETPKLLLLSGVGPKTHLQEMGIPVVAAVEGVGRNFHDHPSVYVPWTIKRGTGTHAVEMLNNLHSLKNYVITRKGYMADAYAGDGWAWVNLGGKDDPLWTDVLVDFSSTSLATFGGKASIIERLKMKEEIYDDVYGAHQGQDAANFLILLARPKSRGRITLNTTHPNDSPVIDLNIFSNKDDLQLMRKGIRMAFRMVNTNSFQNDLQPRHSPKLLTPCSYHGRDTDAYWECYSQYTVFGGFHAAGTAKMAPHTDPMGVVSPRLRVRGVAGLRVSDASIMPAPIATNTMAPTMMIGEKVADMIKEDWGYPTQRIS